LDILDGVDEIKVCVGYKINGKKIREFPPDLTGVEPVYATLGGWQTNTEDVRKYQELPLKARAYIAYIEKFLKCKVSYISVGEMREAIIKKGIERDRRG
jgi:adenylosuccinate synthase